MRHSTRLPCCATGVGGPVVRVCVGWATPTGSATSPKFGAPDRGIGVCTVRRRWRWHAGYQRQCGCPSVMHQVLTRQSPPSPPPLAAWSLPAQWRSDVERCRCACPGPLDRGVRQAGRGLACPGGGRFPSATPALAHGFGSVILRCMYRRLPLRVGAAPTGVPPTDRLRGARGREISAGAAPGQRQFGGACSTLVACTPKALSSMSRVPGLSFFSQESRPAAACPPPPSEGGAA